ncbi:unnamed protein product [Dicrocoelium dendriticum]|nr:unnamed protein product [Dicrocoelium dendriticum]
MVTITALPYSSLRTIAFMRSTVLVSETMLFFSLWRLWGAFARLCGNCISKRRLPLTFVLFAFNFGLVLVDHIHFQYNGFLFGILFLSGSLLIEEQFILAAFGFTMLLNMKHIFIYVVPAYFIYFLFNYVFASAGRRFSGVLIKLLALGLTVFSVMALSLGPYYSKSHLNQLYLRLFPFGRGLTHTYWAPNVWAVYNFAEKVLCSINNYFHLWPSINTITGSLTSGLLGENKYVILPTVTPLHTAILSLVAMLPNLFQCARRSLTFDTVYAPFLGAEYLKVTIGAAWACFLFGWHVHEKAVLMFLLPLNLLAIVDPRFSAVAFYATTLGHYSLIPLIPTRAETPAVLSMFLAYTSVHWLALFRIPPTGDSSTPMKTKPGSKAHGFIGTIAHLHLWGLVPLYICCFIVWPLSTLHQRLPFFPNMATSVYTAVGLVFAFCYFVFQCFDCIRSQSVQTVAGTKKPNQKRKQNEKKIKVQ